MSYPKIDGELLLDESAPISADRVSHSAESLRELGQLSVRVNQLVGDIIQSEASSPRPSVIRLSGCEILPPGTERRFANGVPEVVRPVRRPKTQRRLSKQVLEAIAQLPLPDLSTHRKDAIPNSWETRKT